MHPTTTNNIVLFSARYLPSVGGVEFFTANLGHQLASMGYEVLIVTTEPDGGTAGDRRQQVGAGSLEVLRLDSFGPSRVPFVVHNGRCRDVCARIESLGDFHALINTRFYDLSRLAARLCKRCGVKPVLIDHGTGYIKFPSRLLSLASKVAEHAITANLRRYPIDYYGVSRDASAWVANFGISSCGEIHNALDAEAFVGQQSDRDFRKALGINDDTLCVVFAGRLLEDKGADTMVAAARLLREDLRIHFFVAGRGPMEQVIQEAADELPNLSYVGVLSHPDLAALLVQADVFCLPTRYSEGLPTSLLEAGACSCALVASHAGGVDEIITRPDQGIILAQPTPEEVVVQLQELAEDPERVSRLKRAAKEHICARFTWESTAHEVLAAFGRSSC